ncbi:MAG: nuclear transport factor 2 family protein [Solirubrobacterales bacterium]
MSVRTQPMTDANVELVLEGLEAFLTGEFERALEHAHGDLVTHRAAPDPQTYRGHRGLLQAYADWTADFSDFEMSTEEVIGIGEKVMVEAHQRARGQSSGVPVEGRFWFVYTVRGSKVARLDIFITRGQALDAVGVDDLLEH